MTTTIDAYLPSTVFEHKYEKPNAALSLSDFDNLFSAGDTDFVRNQSSMFPLFSGIESNNSFLVYGKSSVAPSTFVVVRSESRKPNVFLSSEYALAGHSNTDPLCFETDEEDNTLWLRDQSELRTSVFPSAIQEDEEEAVLRGIHPINQRYKILHSQETEIRISALKRWRPTVSIINAFFDDDE